MQMMVSTRGSVPAVPTVTVSEKRRRTILAIDYGRKRIGLALSDELGLTARPLAVLPRTNRKNTIRFLRDLSRRHNVGLIVVGHPLHLTGEASEMSEEASRFAARLNKELGVRVELMDERLTSWQASQTISATGSSSRRGKPLDDVAAAVLLQEYLDRPADHMRSLAPREVR
jgi:putative Holliday junction resolvase